MPLSPGRRPAQVTVRLSYPNRSDGEKRAELVIVDATSSITLAVVELTPDQHFNMMRGLETGEPLNAALLDPAFYDRIGKPQHVFTRSIPRYGLLEGDNTEEDIRAWAKCTTERLGLHQYELIRTNNNAWRVTFRVWSNTLDEDDRRGLSNAIDAAELPHEQ